ncbi:MAG: hypothetical protein K9L31_02675, partial [Candidatus Pacebacteria bacterium]|nr:hypothetical protein [Candidatus Paceibacterota bacterium]
TPAPTKIETYPPTKTTTTFKPKKVTVTEILPKEELTLPEMEVVRKGVWSKVLSFIENVFGNIGEIITGNK